MRKRWVLVLLVVVLGALGVATVALWPRAKAAPVAAPTTTTTTIATTTTTLPEAAAEAADPVGDYVDLYAAPGDVAPNNTLTSPTREGVALALLVKQKGPAGWLQVQYPQRPNEATAWVRAEQVKTRPVDNRVIVSVSQHTLTVYKGTSDVALFQAPVAVGTDRTPTPLGHFYVDIIVDLSYKTGVYGPYQVSVAGFSDVLQSFGGGVGQIAIHGTNQPDLIGSNVSNGCIRMHNEDIITLVPLVRTGSPVTVVA